MGGLTMSVEEAARLLGKSEDWMRRAARRGDVPSRKVGRDRRFTDEDLTDYLDRVRVAGADPWAASPRSQAALRRRRQA